MREWTTYNVDQQVIPFALRELRDRYNERNTIVAIVSLGLILGISGPFNTITMLTLAPRTLYWLFVVATTYAVGFLISSVYRQLFANQPVWLRIICSTLTIGTCVTILMAGLNSLVFEVNPADPHKTLPEWWVVTLISAVVDVGTHLVQRRHETTPPPLMDRIAVGKRGPLISLSAEDHYVKVSTTRGHDMTLIRLSDAMKEVGDTAGLQIHRSHWVALDHVVDIQRVNDRAVAVLSNEETRPISRSYMAAVRDAGLLQRSSNG
ncbi:hypothetical protein FHS72_002976 [Loktanella ponticola]|uniref:HTH LytTR-type domain-containing protein n=1 Tax=Yoonia ponticola TaxID=1524255 RepID=A0A7W9BMR1_9RHOB|nr:LytTR family DNA-binding domain-containing protein [Yoonia ponticola]MBB5723336.1 hypothetical protein [Yoonia ponticola]